MFNKMQWTKDDIPDLSGKTIVITGANSGIGYETARTCAERGAHTILACRDENRGRKAIEKIRAQNVPGKTENMLLDLGSLTSIRTFSTKLLNQFEHLDGLINNAGVMLTPYQLTEDGFESQFGINHLGHFALTGLLMPTLLTTPKSRIVNVSSGAHSMGTMDFDNLIFGGKEKYTSIGAYCRSKLANLLFTKGLHHRLEIAKTGITATAAPPGWSNTRAFRQDRSLLQALFFAQPAAKGALSILRALVDPMARGGDYFGPKGKDGKRGYPVKVETSKSAQDSKVADQLWTISEQLVGITYTYK
jgi:NAD(P)-dependent dehydrogenase (short-subunit alcohol dehydrogenase family)